MKLLLNLLKLRENEGKKIFYFFLFALFLQSGVSIGESVASSLFLVNIGFEQLPIIYILTPIVMILIYIPIYSHFVQRYGEDTFFKVSLIVLTIINVLIVFSIKYLKVYLPPALFNMLFYFVMLYTIIWATALYTLFWNFIDSFFDILDSKRIFSLFSAGTAIGAIAGGTLVTILTQLIAAVDLLLVWSLFAILTLVVLVRIDKKYKKIPIQETEEESDKSGIISQLIFMLKTMKSSRYVSLISIVFFVSIVLATTLEFEYMSILSKDQTEESLAALFGKLFAVVNIFNLVINLFFYNRLVLNFGVRNVSLIQPIAYISAFIYLSVSRDIEAALFGFFVVQGLLVSIDNNNQNLLYNGIKSSVKYQVRTFIENLGEPMAIAVSGIALLVLSNRITPTEITYIAFSLAIVYLISVMALRSEYPKSMVKNLKANWLDFSLDSKRLLRKIQGKDIQQLHTYLQDDNKIELALDILSHHDPLQTLQGLLPYLNTASNEVFEKNRSLLKQLLAHSDPHIPRFTMEWIETNMLSLNLNLIRELGIHGFISSKKISPMFASQDPKRKATSAIITLSSPFPDDLSRANDIINSLIHSADTEDIKEGIYALGESTHSEYAFFIAKFLQDDNIEIRIQALAAILSLANSTLSLLIPAILTIFKDASVKERELALKILSRIKDSQCIVPLLKESNLLNPYERRRIITLILDFGLQTIPSIVTVLVEGRFSFSARSIAARTLGKLAFAQFKSLEEELIIHEIKHAYRLLYKHYVIKSSLTDSSHKRLKLLSEYYKDTHSQILEFILEILTIGGQLPDFEMIKSSINSNNAKSRANAIETIEQSTNKKIFSFLLPLLDARSIKDSITYYKAKIKFEEMDVQEIIDEAIKFHYPLLQNIALELVYHTSNDYKTVFRELLHSTTSAEVKRTIIELLDNRSTTTQMHKLSLLSEHKFFNVFSLYELSMLLNESEIIHVDKENHPHQESSKHVYIKIEDDMSTLAEEIIGLDALLKKESFQFDVFSDAAHYLQLKHESIVQSINTYPTIGITFAKKMSVYETI